MNTCNWNIVPETFGVVDEPPYKEQLLEAMQNEFFRQQVIHISQDSDNLEELGLSSEDSEFRSERSCGYMCLLMGVIYFYGRINYDIENINKDSQRNYNFFDFYAWREKSYPYFSQNSWRNHYWLLQIARELWLYGFYKNLPSSKEEFMVRIAFFLKKDYFITASVDFKQRVENKTEWSHLVVISGYNTEENLLYINDPYNQEEISVDIDDFISWFNWNVFVISKEPAEEWLASSPFLIETNTSSGSNYQIVCPHQDESTALDITSTLEGVDTIIFSQNKERSVRFRAGNHLVRVDPNRLYTYEGALYNILELNKHLVPSSYKCVEQFYKDILEWNICTPSDVQKALEVTKNIRNYFLSSFDLQKPLIALHNNRFMNIEKSFVSYKKHISSKMPQNSFVIVNKIEDFKTLKQKDISVVLIQDVENNGSILDLANIKDIRYFNIETGFDDKNLQYWLLSEIRSILD